MEDLAAPRNKPAGKHDNISLREKLCFFLRPSAKKILMMKGSVLIELSMPVFNFVKINIFVFTFEFQRQNCMRVESSCF